MGARRDELLRTILTNPDDLAARAVYADVLQAEGDPRGELIALELANDPAHATRRDALVAAHAATWWPGLPAHRFCTRAGFVERFAGTAGQLAAARDVFAREPVRDIELVDAHPDTIPFGELGWQAHVTRLTGRGFFGHALYPLCATPLAERLETLDLGGSNLDRDIRPLGAKLPRCRTLVLADNRYLGRHLPVLLDWRHLGKLEALDLCNTRVTAELLRELLALDLRSLRVLRLSGNPLGARAPAVIADALPRLPALVQLELVACEIEPTSLAPLHGVPQLSTTVPDRIVLDLVGMTLALTRVGEDRWAVQLDGRQRTTRWRSVRRDDTDRAERASDWQSGEVAPLDRLAAALACGTPRELTVEGATVRLGAHTGYVYNTSVYSAETARIACSLSSPTVSITFDEYVSIE